MVPTKSAYPHQHVPGTRSWYAAAGAGCPSRASPDPDNSPRHMRCAFLDFYSHLTIFSLFLPPQFKPHTPTTVRANLIPIQFIFVLAIASAAMSEGELQLVLRRGAGQWQTGTCYLCRPVQCTQALCGSERVSRPAFNARSLRPCVVWPCLCVLWDPRPWTGGARLAEVLPQL